jgi:glutathione synthase/RimK-type ligase-like ATP-grasp enzyme
MILIIFYQGDKHLDVVQKKIEQKGEESVLLDYALFPKFWQCSLTVTENGNELIFVLDGGRIINGKEIKSVWFRRINSPKGDCSVSENPLVNDYIRLESKTFLRSLPFILDAFWISRPEFIESASLKPYQLILASALGFRIPKTALGNSPTAAMSLMALLRSKEVVIKSLDMPLVKINNFDRDNGSIIYSTPITSEILSQNQQMIANCPIIAQELIQKECDIRVTVVGERVFAAAIRMDKSTSNQRVDWRHYQVKHVYEPHVLQLDIKDKCLMLVRKLGLVFGCIDLAYTQTGEYIFFEINPGGQWLPTELYTGANISGALVEMMLSAKII